MVYVLRTGEAGRQARLDPHGCLKVQTDLGTDLMSG